MKISAVVSSRIVLCLCLVWVFSGCAKLSHLQELLTLKAYSDEKDRQEKYVKERDAQFDKLCQVVQDGTIVQYRNTSSVTEAFGAPIVTKAPTAKEPLSAWIYRYQVKYSGSKKVYLYFDAQELLQKWEFVPAEK